MMNIKQNKKKNGMVDLIKFLSALLVIFSHSFPLSSNLKDILSRNISNISFGALAVAIFFSFSGYYITKSIEKSEKNFLLKRLKRLLPELIVVVLITVFIVGPIFTNLNVLDYFMNKKTYLYLINAIMIPYHNLPGVFTYNIYGSTVNGALWTIIVEFACYCYIYIIYKLFKKFDNKSLIILFFALFLSLTSGLIFSYLKIEILKAMIRPFLIFSISSVVYTYREKIQKKYFWICTIISIILILLRQNITFNIFLIFLLPVILYYVTNNIKLKPCKTISFLGELSYPIYLVGFVTQQSLVALFGGSMNSYVNFILASIISIVIASVINLLSNKLMKKSNIL